MAFFYSKLRTLLYSIFDPISEFKLYQKFTDITKGKTTILVSHRMGICKLCDKIAVFSEGKLLQFGTHSDLIQKKTGLYATMYNEQAKYYI
jgi:ABC-type multidrug transport system fused ATPase/permease subunit